MPQAELGQHPYQYQLPTGYPAAPNIPQRNNEDSVASWLGTLLLLAIPLIGLIVLIIMACGGMGTRAKQNYARAAIIMVATFVIIGAAVIGIGFAMDIEWITENLNS